MGKRSVLEYRGKYLPRGVRCFVTRSHFALHWTASCGVVYDGVFREFSTAAAEPQLYEVFTCIWGRKMKRKDRNELRTADRHAEPGPLLATFPNLSEFLTAAVFEDTRDRRESPTVTVWAVGGQWKLAVKDRAEGLVLWLTAESLLEVLQLLELYCLEPSAPWRHDDQSHERNGKRVGKKT